jgi:hypothetical protein
MSEINIRNSKSGLCRRVQIVGFDKEYLYTPGGMYLFRDWEPMPDLTVGSAIQVRRGTYVWIGGVITRVGCGGIWVNGERFALDEWDFFPDYYFSLLDFVSAVQYDNFIHVTTEHRHTVLWYPSEEHAESDMQLLNRNETLRMIHGIKLTVFPETFTISVPRNIVFGCEFSDDCRMVSLYYNHNKYKMVLRFTEPQTRELMTRDEHEVMDAFFVPSNFNTRSLE